MSQATTLPSSGKARAAARVDAPVKTPISMTFLAFKASIKLQLQVENRYLTYRVV